ncbi:MAG: hypothetical protein E6Q83_03730 [Thiothrix sp.]|nr:MAG: hypothetical protein E6Q83_03730 [Thiothrix sp.]
MSREDRAAKLAESFIRNCSDNNVDPLDFEVALCLMTAVTYLSTENKERFSGAIKAEVQGETIH